MLTARDTLALIGNTPLVRLKGPSEETGCDIFGKCEFANPGASVKDRAALFIVEDAEARGQLKPGGTIVEGTAGNTGIGLALVANAKGYRTIIVMPDTQSREKMDTLRALGAELVTVPAAPYSSQYHFVHTSRRIAEETPGAIWANQFDNIANRKAHIAGTAEEIWTQMDGRIDGFTCAVGTGGTFAGVGMGLKAKDEKVTIALSDPYGAALYSYYACGELKAEGTSVAEGIGQGRITANLEGAPVDTQFRIPDQEGCVSACRRGSTLRGRSGWRANWGRASASRRFCATRVSVTFPRSTTRNGSPPKGCSAENHCKIRQRHDVALLSCDG